MRNIHKYAAIIGIFLVSVILFSSCKDFLNPDEEINITEDKLYDDWYEYRAIEMGLYGIQAQLVEQLVILGELRGDLLQITENATADMVEVYNFDISKENKYASPTTFFKLISACNSFIAVLEKEHPEVTDQANKTTTNYDKLYGEALCMRAWAYFNAVRIYGKVPFIPESLTTIDEVNNFINSPGTYTYNDSIVYEADGWTVDTTYTQPIQLEKQYYDISLVIDHFTDELENKVKAVGVNHYIDNNDQSWEISIWNTYAWHTLLGVMYLTSGDLAKASDHFEKIIKNSTENYRYQLDQSFSFGSWRNIFGNIDGREHIFSVWFGKNYFQQNDFQVFFDAREPHKFMLKPTRNAIINWESIFSNSRFQTSDSNPTASRTIFSGIPGDFARGYGVSYAYLQNGVLIPPQLVQQMLWLKSREDYRTASILVEGADTVVWKYSWNKGVFDQDANFPLYRAAGVHLWLAEIYVWRKSIVNGVLRESTGTAVSIVNNGSNYSTDASRPQLGVRGRVGFGGTNDGIQVGNINYVKAPFTNEIIDYIDLTGDFYGKQIYLEDQIIKEKARELAFEGERFYDLMRVAKRRNDPSFLADRVASKFPEGQREQIRNKLMNEDNWYIHYFE